MQHEVVPYVLGRQSVNGSVQSSALSYSGNTCFVFSSSCVHISAMELHRLSFFLRTSSLLLYSIVLNVSSCVVPLLHS